MFIYSVDNFKIFSTDCVEIFSQCNFGGTPIYVCTSNPIFHGNFVMRSIHIPTGFNIDLVNEGDYGLGEMTALVSTSFSCLGATKYTKATLV